MPLYQLFGVCKRSDLTLPVSYAQQRQGIRLALYFVALILTFAIGLLASR